MLIEVINAKATAKQSMCVREKFAYGFPKLDTLHDPQYTHSNTRDLAGLLRSANNRILWTGIRLLARAKNRETASGDDRDAIWRYRPRRLRSSPVAAAVAHYYSLQTDKPNTLVSSRINKQPLPPPVSLVFRIVVVVVNRASSTCVARSAA